MPCALVHPLNFLVPPSLAHKTVHSAFKMLDLCRYGSYTVNTPSDTYELVTVPPKPTPEKKKPSRDAPVRWVALIGYLLVTIPSVVGLIVLMILKKND